MEPEKVSSGIKYCGDSLMARLFELCGGFKLHKRVRPQPANEQLNSPASTPTDMTSPHTRATRRLILCLDGSLLGSRII